jgi:hypothetical protein
MIGILASAKGYLIAASKTYFAKGDESHVPCDVEKSYRLSVIGGQFFKSGQLKLCRVAQ